MTRVTSVASTTQADSVDAGSGFVSSSRTTPSLSNDRSPIESRYAWEAAVAAENPSLSDCIVGVLDMVLIGRVVQDLLWVGGCEGQGTRASTEVWDRRE